ncbi:hypothetical protein C7H62_0485 [Mesoflavibacter sp. HG96]|uniref:hypothetical protein n=1 Tax=unclassified Mesoflavibacter TaxID=2630131 RepID=UPI0011B222A5|nr:MULTISPECIES: hypothetical protein [unclassified Mesoflavibacter]QIJ88294.1 hypothetical protein C7H62_0485 [Mesoflavibacter sp. HG96]QIJ91022.1 hypothetical protein C7H56_0485 [Mesoflavibacter sp. HG37]
MRINIITSKLKKANRNLNLSLLIFGLFMLLFFISFWFPKSDLMKSVYLISLFASGVLIIVSIILIIFRQSKKQTIELDKTEIAELTINSQIGAEKITKDNEIEFSGNEIKTKSESKVYEINNKSAFELLKTGQEIRTKSLTKKTNGLDMSPKELFNDLMSMLWASS